MERTYGCTIQVVVNINGPSCVPVGSTGKITSIGNKKQQEATSRKEISKRWQPRDESESDTSSGSKVHYNIETSNESPVVTTRAKYKAQEAAIATASVPQAEEGGADAESNGEHPPTDNA
ncbi:hypothetical protein HAX54_053152 [Datura stramonium]|uniref:Uncharacterized protein n=1 Tax=Datura stramonium TaxID=4076 RepID=A0ABS8WPA8_DATST|nr:hypothetical protein [Datura stramonium]